MKAKGIDVNATHNRITLKCPSSVSEMFSQMTYPIIVQRITLVLNRLNLTWL
jgi:hypothetical protein